jgi:hypothetical protein
VDLRPGIYNLARERAWPVHELRRDVRTLEAVFNEMATTASRAKQPSDSAEEVAA